MSVLAEALAWYQCGYMPIPTATDGSKRPGVTSWRDWQTTRPDPGTIISLFTGDTDGLGLICGPASGNLEMLELEGRAVAEGYLQRLTDAFDAHDATELWATVNNGYSEQTPSGGIHWYYRVDGPAAPNTKLARRPATPDELATSPERNKVLIETRGTGGFSVIAPSAGRTHPNGHAWTTLHGSRDTIPTLTVQQRDTLHAIASTLDETPAVEWTTSRTPTTAPADGELRPGDDYNQRATWADILTPHGWALAWRRGSLCGWTRPGKNPRDGISATTGRNPADNLYVFSTSTDFEAERPYSKFAAHTLLNHAGDFTAATRELRATGYGTPSSPLAGLHDGAGRLADIIPINPPSTPTSDGTAALQPAPTTVEELLERLTREELLKLRARTRAREILAAETAPAAEPFDLDTLGSILARPADPPMRIEQLLPWAAAMLIVAQRKAGKTTLTLNLARCLITGDDFLDRYPVRPIDGNIALLNYEVSARQIATWADDHGLDHERLHLVNLRGRRNPLTHPADTQRLADELRTRNIETLIVDPFGRAYTGQSQNDAGEVGAWLIALDQFARTQVGALDLILTAHAGWNGERTRGSSALEDWADVFVNLTRDHDDNNEDSAERYFKAEGRDVEIPESQLHYNADTRTLTLSGAGSRRKARESQRRDGLAGPALELITLHPGITHRDIQRRLREALGGVRDSDVAAALRHLIDTDQAHRIDAPNGKPKPIHPGPAPMDGF